MMTMTMCISRASNLKATKNAEVVIMRKDCHIRMHGVIT
jgi:hypothetical protein